VAAIAAAVASPARPHRAPLPHVSWRTHPWRCVSAMLSRKGGDLRGGAETGRGRRRADTPGEADEHTQTELRQSKQTQAAECMSAACFRFRLFAVRVAWCSRAGQTGSARFATAGLARTPSRAEQTTRGAQTEAAGDGDARSAIHVCPFPPSVSCACVRVFAVVRAVLSPLPLRCASAFPLLLSGPPLNACLAASGPTHAANTQHTQKGRASIALFICCCLFREFAGAGLPFRRGCSALVCPFGCPPPRPAAQRTHTRRQVKPHSGLEQDTSRACVSPRAAPTATSVAGRRTTAPCLLRPRRSPQLRRQQQHTTPAGSSNSDSEAKRTHRLNASLAVAMGGGTSKVEQPDRSAALDSPASLALAATTFDPTRRWSAT
jgi:hypothetical protein